MKTWIGGRSYMRTDMLHPADQLVMIMDRIYRYGMTTTSGGNLSIKDENGDIWITPSGIDKGSLTRKDIICVKPDSTIVGIHKPSMELPFHSQVYLKRPDIKAIVHAHPPALVAFSIARKIPDTSLVPDVHLMCGPIGMAEYDIPGSTELGDKISAVFEKGYNNVLLENHGIVVAAESLFKAFMVFETLDFCARMEASARRIGEVKALSRDNTGIADYSKDTRMYEVVPEIIFSKEKEARREMCGLIRRAYDQRLFTSTQGAISARIDDSSFIITPADTDRKYIKPEDLVRIENGKKEAGKTPDRSVLLHQHIYDIHPHVNSVIVAQPPNVMAFAVSDQAMDSRLIPESYIMLRDVLRLPFGCVYSQPETTAARFLPGSPVAIVENDCLVVTGHSLLNAFDRLEVAEYSAQSIISARVLGGIVTIDDKQINDLKDAFNLY